LEPIKIVVTNWEDAKTNGDIGMVFEVQNSPTDPGMGSHAIEVTQTLYIDATDFRLVDDAGYYGLAPNKAVGLKYYGGNLICDEVVFEEGDAGAGAGDNKKQTIKELKCRLDNTEGRSKPKTWISWVPAETAIPCEIRVYSHLFTVPEPTDCWEEEINPKSEIIYANGFIDPSVRQLVDKKDISPIKSNQALQFERMGYFVVDVESTYDASTNTGKLIFNRTVTLKEEVNKKKAGLSKREEEANAARKAKQKADLEAKEARMKIDPKDLFQQAEEYKGKYSKFDDATGLPTHTADGTELTKSGIKKLKKEQDKHAKQLKKFSMKK